MLQEPKWRHCGKRSSIYIRFPSLPVKKDTHPLGADHHKDEISVDFDRVGCQILDDSIAVGGRQRLSIFFLEDSLLLLQSEKKEKKRKDGQEKREACRKSSGVSKLCIEGAERKSSGIK
jgi:hypothetical protein